MLCPVLRFLADDAGHAAAETWLVVGSVLLLGSALTLLAWQRYLDEQLPTARPIPVKVSRP